MCDPIYQAQKRERVKITCLLNGYFLGQSAVSKKLSVPELGVPSLVVLVLDVLELSVSWLSIPELCVPRLGVLRLDFLLVLGSSRF